MSSKKKKENKIKFARSLEYSQRVKDRERETLWVSRANVEANGLCEWTRCGSISSLKQIEANEGEKRLWTGWKTWKRSVDIEREGKNYFLVLWSCERCWSIRTLAICVSNSRDIRFYIHQRPFFCVSRSLTHISLTFASFSSRIGSGHRTVSWTHSSMSANSTMCYYTIRTYTQTSTHQTESNHFLMKCFLCNREWHGKWWESFTLWKVGRCFIVADLFHGKRLRDL